MIESTYCKKLKPGDRVRFISSAWSPDWWDNALVATEGSVATVVSYEEYVAHFSDAHPEDLAWVKESIEDGTYYPIRFEFIMPLSEDELARYQKEYDHFQVMLDKVGDIGVWRVDFFEKITE